jgi:peptide/nickel transport system substrate-binding protein
MFSKNIWFIVLAVLFYSGCGGPVAERDDGLVRVALQADATTMDPHAAADAGSMRILENLHSTLFRFTEVYGETEPYLVREHQIREDGRLHEFLLHENVVFHSGRPLTAEDAVFSLNRIREDGVRGQQLGPIEDIEVQDTHRFRIRLSAPFTPLIPALAHPMNAILDRAAVEEAGDETRFEELQAGAGPFRLVEWRRGRHARLGAFENYFIPGLPRLREIVYRPIPDATAANTALRRGEVDLLLDLNPRDIDRLQTHDGITVEQVPGTFWEYIGLNTAAAPLDNPDVRKAIAHAVDRDALARMVKFGHAQPLTGGHIPPNHPAHLDEKIFPAQNIDRTKALLAEAGHPDGFDITILVGSDFDYQVNAAQVLRQQLAEVGINVSVQALETGVFFNRLGNGDFEMTVVGWLGFVDADEWTFDLFHSTGAFNQQNFSDPGVDQLLERGRTLPDGEERWDVYREAQRRVATLAPMVFLYLNDRAAAFADGLTGFDVHPTLTTLSLREAHWGE